MQTSYPRKVKIKEEKIFNHSLYFENNIQILHFIEEHIKINLDSSSNICPVRTGSTNQYRFPTTGSLATLKQTSRPNEFGGLS